MTHFLAVFGKSTGNIAKTQLIMQIVSNETCLVVKKDRSRRQERPVLHASKTGLFLLFHPLFWVEACTLFA